MNLIIRYTPQKSQKVPCMNKMSLIAKMVNQIPKAKMGKPTVYLTNLWSRKIFSIVEESELSKCPTPRRRA